jgi:glycosyltransferase involved in cell wall biosynthesis
MWDNVQMRPQAWWDALPKTVRVVAFAVPVAARAAAAGLRVLRLQYFKNPMDFSLARWDAGRVLLYWNRAGLYHAGFLRRLCAALGVKKLIFRAQTDPHYHPAVKYDLPARLGRVEVTQIDGMITPQAHLALLGQANMFLAPRMYEGVGMTTLEALASGCAVFGADMPALNEYIVHRKTGYLFRYGHDAPYQRALAFAARGWWRLRRKLRVRRTLNMADWVTPHQAWREIGALDHRAMGAAAREAHAEGYARWRATWDEYRAFVAAW